MGKRLRTRFVEATELATLTLGELAEAIDRQLRTLIMYRQGDRRVTPEVARALARHLRERGARLQRAARELERAADQEEAKR